MPVTRFAPLKTMTSHPLPRSLLFSALLLCAACGLRAQRDTVTTTGAVVTLPTYTIVGEQELPPPESWRYTQILGFEILSNASDKATKRLIADFERFNRAIDVVWPTIRGHNPSPVSLIICGRGGKFDAFVPKNADAGPWQGKVSLFLRNREHSAIVLDLQTRELALAAMDATEGSSGFIEVDSYKQLHREYVLSLLARSTPRMGAWMEEALAQLLSGMEISPTSIEFAKLDEANASIRQSAGGQFNRLYASSRAGVPGGQLGPFGGLWDDTPTFDGAWSGTPGPMSSFAAEAAAGLRLPRGYLMPFPELFAVKHNDPTARNPINSEWSRQATAFVHMCLYRSDKSFQKGLMTFVRRSTREPITEALFKECFGIGYDKMLRTMRDYSDFSVYKSMAWRAKKGSTLGDPTPVVLREATQSEVGRIKGEALLLAGLNETARTALITPYARGERDPRLLAALGLFERTAGTPERARKFLEAAAAAKVVRPLAYLELARLRLHAALTAGGDTRLTAEQTSEIIAPLLIAREQSPPMAETYELMSHVYARSADVPKPDIMAMLVYGANLNPRQFGHIYRTAALFLRIGDFKDAGALIEHGLRYAPAGVAQTRFSELKAKLPPEAPANR